MKVQLPTKGHVQLSQMRAKVGKSLLATEKAQPLFSINLYLSFQSWRPEGNSQLPKDQM